jgi:hypothetical protein
VQATEAAEVVEVDQLRSACVPLFPDPIPGTGHSVKTPGGKALMIAFVWESHCTVWFFVDL